MTARAGGGCNLPLEFHPTAFKVSPGMDTKVFWRYCLATACGVAVASSGGVTVTVSLRCGGILSVGLNGGFGGPTGFIGMGFG